MQDKTVGQMVPLSNIVLLKTALKEHTTMAMAHNKRKIPMLEPVICLSSIFPDKKGGQALLHKCTMN